MAHQLPRRLGLFDAVTVVIGTIIGSGIFLVPNLVAQRIHSPGATLAVWMFSGVLSLCGALVFAELGAMMPRSGGQYVYLRAAFGPLIGFLCGWTFFLTLLSAAIAWLATAFATYLGYFMTLTPAAQKAVAVGLIAVLTFVNYRGVKAGAIVQNVFTILKALGIALIIGAALMTADRTPAVAAAAPGVSDFGGAMVACLLTYDGWVALSFLAGEVKRPQRNIPLGLLLGLGACVVIYVLANYAYLRILSPIEMAATERVAARVAEVTLGQQGAQAVAGIILISTVGGCNGWMMAAPRLYFAQAQDGLLFPIFGRIHPRYLTPAYAIVMQGVWAAVLCLTGTYQTLAAYAMFSAWLLYGVTAIGMMVLRTTRPDAERPYKTPAYPVLPVVFAAVAFGFVLNLFGTDPGPAFSCMAIIVAGVPAYFVWTRVRRKVE